MGMGIREYATHRGVSHVAVIKALKSGRIQKEADGTIDPVNADAAWARNTNPAQQRRPVLASAIPVPVPAKPLAPSVRQPTHRPAQESGPSTAGMPNYQMSRAVRETYNAKLARLDYEERSSKLLNAEDVAKDAVEVARRVRGRVFGIPGQMAAVLASETDSRVIERLLGQELRTALEELSR